MMISGFARQARFYRLYRFRDDVAQSRVFDDGQTSVGKGFALCISLAEPIGQDMREGVVRDHQPKVSGMTSAGSRFSAKRPTVTRPRHVVLIQALQSVDDLRPVAEFVMLA